MDNVGPEYIRWAYRLFLDREPETETVLERTFPNSNVLRQAFIASDEFREKNRGLVFGFPGMVIKETKYGFRLWVSLRELAICRAILMEVYEDVEAQFMCSTVRPGDHVIDAGANIGFFTMLLAQLVRPGGSVRAFEPLDFLFDALRRSTAENRFESSVELYQLALSDIEGAAFLRHAPGTTNFGGGHVVTGDGSATPHSHVDVPIQMIRLDALMDERRVSFIKMDVEGAEPKLIQGGDSLLRRDRPLILSELHNAQLHAVSGVSATDFIEQMRRLGYRCRELPGEHGGKALTSYRKDQPMNVIFDPS